MPASLAHRKRMLAHLETNVIELTLDEKLSGAVSRAREEECEKHFFDAGQPHYPRGFSVGYRNPGHWDVYAPAAPGQASAWLAAHPGGKTSAGDNDRERAFRIRGEPGAVVVFDERWNPHRPHPRETLKFRSAMAAMLWIAEELMIEPPPMSDFAFGATFAMLVMTAIVFLTGYGVCIRDYWRDSKLPPRQQFNSSPVPGGR